MIDIHSHIIPKIDDGSKEMEMTLEMLRNAERDGTKEIVATPHYLMEYGEATIDEVKQYVKEINSAIEKEGIDLKVYSGQEIYFTENIIQYYLDGKIGTINDSRYMLIEFPMTKFDDNVFDILYELQVRNISPVIAHPERYREIIKNPMIVNRFIDEGYLFQMNAGSLEGLFGTEAKKTAEILLKNGIYNFIGSDAHNTKSRTTGILNAIKLANSKNKNSEKIFIDSSKKMLNDEDIEFLGTKIKKKKSFFSFFKR
ncbi:tyrosine-protein phosphatase [Clostridium taeniosporum]|uniref:protein-tyrosine-phosphatase n=1 Tax=Clostridium taeniosporum TaxID=394958 RepID=A0A1D7XN66_9CLOT|nr:CpsB/CapC family capsule biosynthesis tyrosine phosphatase [Clostridium taeniosporum]AOR24754.1 capsular biosynthesis protein [Clostridium taeniosporum]